MTSSMTSLLYERVSMPACERTPARVSAWPGVAVRVVESSHHRIFWQRVVARAWVFGPEVFRFCRSWADGSSCGTSFVKFFSDLRKLEWETRGSLGICGGAWWLRCWRSVWVLYIKVLRRFLWVDFLWNLVRNFRNPGWETADVVGLVATLVYFGSGHFDSVWHW